jgi:hypothetical protein
VLCQSSISWLLFFFPSRFRVRPIREVVAAMVVAAMVAAAMVVVGILAEAVISAAG